MVSLRRLLACQCLVISFVISFFVLRSPLTWSSANSAAETGRIHPNANFAARSGQNGTDSGSGSGYRNGTQGKDRPVAALSPSSVENLEGLDMTFNINKPAMDTKDLHEYCQAFLTNLKRPTRQKCMGWFSKKGEKNITANLSAPRRIALLVRGEAFRRNTGMYDRNVHITNKSLYCQLEAVNSHVQQIIEPFEACGVEVKVFIQTWKPEGDLVDRAIKAFVDAYQGRVVWQAFINHNVGLKSGKGQAMNFIAGLGGVSKYYHHTGVKFDAVFIIRADLIFKQSLLGLAKEIGRSWALLMFAFHEYEMGGGYPSKVPKQRLPDTIFWVPWLFVNCMLQNGWQEHNWAAVSQFVGDYMGLLMKDEYHDANSAIDRNPLYSQACRKEQAYDIHGGFGVAIFSTQPTRDTRARAAHLSSTAKTFFKQGEPMLMPVKAKAYHSWTTGKTHCNIPDFCFSLKDSHEKPPVFSDTTGWEAWLKSMKIAAKLLATHGEIKFHQTDHPKYRLDRAVFTRDDYTFKTSHFSIYGFNTSNATYVGFGAKDFPSVPTMIVTSGEGLLLIDNSKMQKSNISETADGALKYLEKLIGLPTVVVCTIC